jgi:hypothetical protein
MIDSFYSCCLKFLVDVAMSHFVRHGKMFAFLAVKGRFLHAVGDYQKRHGRADIKEWCGRGYNAFEQSFNVLPYQCPWLQLWRTKGLPVPLKMPVRDVPVATPSAVHTSRAAVLSPAVTVPPQLPAAISVGEHSPMR